MKVNKEKFILSTYYWACAFILWTYMSISLIKLYKSWYISTALVVIFASIFLLKQFIRCPGLLKSALLIVSYYLYLLLTSLWAQFPATTIWYVATEIIYIMIFMLFYFLSAKFTPDRVVDFFANLLPPAVVIFITDYVLNPESSRHGGYVLVLLPIILLFCTFRLIQNHSLKNVAFVTASLLMLVLGVSRTPLLIAGVGLFLIFLTISDTRKLRLKFVLISLVVIAIASVTVLVVPQLRINVAKTISRITYLDIAIDSNVIEAEKPDVLRWLIHAEAISLYKDNSIMGIGYMNFMPWFGDKYNIVTESGDGKEIVGMNLHNTYQTWLLEGGLPCVVLVFMLLRRYFNIISRNIKTDKNNYNRAYFKLLAISMVCVLIEGLFHQIHQAPVFFILLGLVLALNSRLNYCKIINRNVIGTRPNYHEVV